MGEFRKPESPRKIACIACIALYKNKSKNVMVALIDTGCDPAKTLGHLVHMQVDKYQGSYSAESRVFCLHRCDLNNLSLSFLSSS